MSPEEIFAKANIDPRLCLFCHPNEGMILHETENFLSLLCNFPASIGHIMISSKAHYGSMGELEGDWFRELAVLKNEITNWYQFQGKESLFYEHGRAGSCHAVQEVGMQCEHFHLNVLAAPICIHDELAKIYGMGIQINKLEETRELFDEWGEYLFFENSKGKAVFYPVADKEVPSHLLRTLLCQKLNHPEKANWEKHQVYSEFLENFSFVQELPSYLEKSVHALF